MQLCCWVYQDQLRTDSSSFDCGGQGEKGATVPIRGIVLENITVKEYGSPGECVYANVSTTGALPRVTSTAYGTVTSPLIILSTRKDALFEWTGLSPPLPRGAGCGGQELLCTVNASSTGCYDDSATRGLGT
jgi:hypothetical protein